MFFDIRRIDERARPLCICIPHAGGNSTAFAPWYQLLSGHMEVLPVRLPGRGVRFDESPYFDFATLLEALAPATAAVARGKFVLFGHSLGALIAYELACSLEQQYGLQPAHLFVAGARSPGSPRPGSAHLLPSDHRLDDGQLLQRLAALGGIAPEVRDSAELLELALPAIRADLEVYESYRPPNGAEQRGVSCPLTALGGWADLDDVPESSLRDWGRYSGGRFELCMLPGDHFFPHSQAKLVTQLIAYRSEASP